MAKGGETSASGPVWRAGIDFGAPFPRAIPSATSAKVAEAQRGREGCRRCGLGLKQDGGPGRVLQCGQPGVVPDLPGTAAARRGGGF